MTKPKAAKKITKKYSLTRSAIAERLDELMRELRDIDTFDTSPQDVTSALADIADSLDRLTSDLSDEQY